MPNLITLNILNVIFVTKITFNIIVEIAKNISALIATFLFIEEESMLSIIDLEWILDNNQRKMMNPILARNTQVNK
jgi:uncharacterized protein YebE (UPF0316 family)